MGKWHVYKVIKRIKKVQVIAYKLNNTEDITPHLKSIESFYMNTFMSADMLMGQH